MQESLGGMGQDGTCWINWAWEKNIEIQKTVSIEVGNSQVSRKRESHENAKGTIDHQAKSVQGK